MATTSGNLVAGKAASQGSNGNNGRYGLKAKLAAGVAILGCAGALAFGGLRAERAAQPAPSVAPAASTAPADLRAQQRFLEQNLVLPSGGAATMTPALSGGSYADTIFELEQLRNQATQGVTPNGGAVAPRLDWMTIRLIEQNQLPESTFSTTATGGAYHAWTGTCRAGSSECLPDEDFASQARGSGVLDWEQQERGQVAPGPAASVSSDYQLGTSNEAEPDGDPIALDLALLLPSRQPLSA